MAGKSNNSQAQRATSSANKRTSKKSSSDFTTASKQGSAQKRNVKKPQSNASSSARAKREAFERQKQEQKQNRRVWLGVIFVALALVVVLCWFNTETLLLGPLSRFITGMFGAVGKFILPVLLVYNAIILIISYGYPVRMRTWCGFFAMVLLCGVIHSIAAAVGKREIILNPVVLWKDALVMRSGGMIPGFVAELLTRFIGRVGAIIFMVIGAIICGFATRSITPFGVVNAVKKRTPQPVRREREDPSERFVERIVQVHQVKQARKKSTKDFDLEVDDPPLLKKQEEKREDRWDRTISPSEYMERRERHSDSRGASDIDMDQRQMTMDDVELHEPREPKRPAPPRKKIVMLPEKKTRTEDEDDAHEVHRYDYRDVAGGGTSVVTLVEEEQDEVEETPTAPVSPPAQEHPQKSAEQVSRAEARASAAVISAEIAEQEPLPAVYVFPSIELLNRASGGSVDATAEMRGNTKRLADALQSFGVNPHIVDVIRGPSVTRYELELDPGVKLSKITNLSEDIALALGAQGVRISAIPDKISVVGIEVPNKIVNTVYAREVIGSSLFDEKKSKVSFAVGKDISGNCIIGDIGKMPHMLIAGTTGSGKSVCMNTLIISLLYKARPDEVKMIMVDPKMVELGIYNGIPHLLIPVVTDPKKAAGALQWTVTEMLRRYSLMRDEGVRDLESYNKAVANDPDREKLPQVVVVIDELADLMLVAAKEVEESICRIAQMGRASGIHLVIATQRPSADVITGTMKANIPSRIAFSVSSAMESRIILDIQGAEKLVGKGDMLFAPHGQGKPQRVQGCFITDDEVSRVVNAIKANGNSDYSHEVMEQIEKRVEQGSKNSSSDVPAPPESTSDEMLPAAVEVILETGQASVSMLQRRLKLGYARAARIVDEMQEMGIVGQFEGSKPRQLLITREQWEQMKNGGSTTVPDEIP